MQSRGNYILFQYRKLHSGSVGRYTPKSRTRKNENVSAIWRPGAGEWVLTDSFCLELPLLETPPACPHIG
eukprot:64788-Rhodomonas_salina.2